MKTLTLSGLTALQFYRMPPPLLHAVLLSSEDDEFSLDHLFCGDSLLADLLTSPLHTLAHSAAQRIRRLDVASHIVSGELPRGSILQIGTDLFVTSPALTLLTLAKAMDAVELALVISEMLGSFTVFESNDHIRAVMDIVPEGTTLPHDLDYPVAGKCTAWRNVTDLNRHASSLWTRPPLLEMEQLERYVDACPHITGIERLRNALRFAVPHAASPFEVQAVILLSQPRRRGGAGLPLQGCNVPIRLSRDARYLYDKRICYADLLFQGATGRSLIVECQSMLCHGGADQLIRDFDRAAALQAMGYEVVHLTHRTLRDETSCAAFERLIYRLLRIPWKERTARLERSRDKLRLEILHGLWENGASHTRIKQKHQVRR